jgi:nucleoid-associated protein YgaU
VGANLAIEPGSLQLEQPPPSNEPAPRPSPAPAAVAEKAEAGSEAAPVGGRIDPITHVVRRGETFYSIARYYYGSGRFYRALWMANRDQVPDLSQPLWVGSAILVPAPEDLDRAYIDPPRPLTGSRPASSNDSSRGVSAPMDERAERTGRFLPAAAGDSALSLPRSSGSPPTVVEPAPASDPAPTPRSRARVHVVRGPYETLRSIARQELGDPDRAQELMELNAGQISDPNHLDVGARVRLPEPR